MSTRTQSEGTVVVVDDDPSIRMLVRAWLEHAGYEVVDFESGEAALAGLGSVLPDAICLDISMPGLGGIETLERLRIEHSRIPVIMLTADTTVDSVVSAMNMGAYDYLAKPIGQTRLIKTLRNAVDHARTRARLAELEREEQGGYAGIIGNSPAMRSLFRQMDRVAVSDITALVHGESGSGKELVARAIHDHSGRANGPFIALNCAAIPETLQESELFGYEKGAFTGANARRAGRFEQADGGTLFLDEIGELSLTLQAKLLRVIQERRFYRVGGSQEIGSDFRLLAATHKSLRDLVQRGAFREDFYFRIAVFEIEVPPLRARLGDVPRLAQHFIDAFAEQVGKSGASLAPEALAAIATYPWPGNVRELQNAVHRALVSTPDDVIRLRDLPSRVWGAGGSDREASPSGAHPPVSASNGRTPTIWSSPALPAVDKDASVDTMASVMAGAEPPNGVQQSRVRRGQGLRTMHDDGRPLTLAEIERDAILTAVERNDGNMAAVVRDLGIGRTTLYRKLKKYNREDEA